MTEENKSVAAEAATTQEISTETTPAQETAETTTETTQSTPATETKVEETENWEYNGDRKAIPKPFEKYVKGLDRYVSKKDQAIAEARKKAEEYDKFTSSEQYKAYQQFIANQAPAAGRAVPQEPVVTQDEIDAISLGDAKTLEKVIDRAVQRKLESTIGPKEQEMTKQLQAVTMKQKELESAEMIQAFADVNPDFWELYDSGFEDYIVTAVKSGRSLEDAYKGAKTIEAKQAERLEAQRKATFEKKKAGSVVGKSITGTPDVVYADNEDHAKRLAIELTLKGDKRHVRIKPKN
jgi:hypothetical protein